MKNNFLKQIFSFIIVFLMFSLVTFGGPEKCSPSNYKFNKTYSKITHPLLPNDFTVLPVGNRNNNAWKHAKLKSLPS